jgi:hypothetical protein
MSWGGNRSDGATGPGFNGSIDEVAIWDRPLTETEIFNLYNSGDGLALDPSASVEVANEFPSNTVTLISTSVSFNGTLTPSVVGGDTLNLTNATLIVFNSTGSLFNNTVVNQVTGTVKNSSGNLTILSMNFDEYNWSILGCGNQTDGTGVCGISSNFTLKVSRFQENNVSFLPITTEGASEVYEIFINLSSSVQLTPYFLYNNTDEGVGTEIDLGNNQFKIRKTMDIPLVSSTKNVNFTWRFDYDDDFSENTSVHWQNITSLEFATNDGCNFTFLNLTAIAEEDQRVLVGTDDNTTIEVDIDLFTPGTTNSIANFSNNFTKTNPVVICLNNELNTTSYRTDAVIRYEASPERISEFYHIQNFTATNNTIPQNIRLFDLKVTDSQEFLITFKDASFLPVSDALIDITRNYIQEGAFKTVERPLTDVEGTTLGHFVLGDVIYTIQVSKNGRVLGIFNNVVVRCEDQSTGNCKLNLNAFGSGINVEDLEESNNLSWVFTFDRNTRDITTTYNVLSGGVSTINVTGILFDNFNNNTICSDQDTSSAGTLVCNVPVVWGNATVLVELRKDGTYVTSTLISLRQTLEDIYGATGKSTALLLGLLMFMTIPLMFITGLVGVVIGGIIGLILAVILTFGDTGGLIGGASALIWLIVAGAILIWKIRQDE